jgi:hypothetical protein
MTDEAAPRRDVLDLDGGDDHGRWWCLSLSLRGGFA